MKAGFFSACLILVLSVMLILGISIPILSNNAFLDKKKESWTTAKANVILIRSAVRDYVDNNGNDTASLIGKLSNKVLLDKLNITAIELSSTYFSVHDYYILSVNKLGEATVAVNPSQTNTPKGILYADKNGIFGETFDLFLMMRINILENDLEKYEQSCFERR